MPHEENCCNLRNRWLWISWWLVLSKIGAVGLVVLLLKFHTEFNTAFLSTQTSAKLCDIAVQLHMYCKQETCNGHQWPFYFHRRICHKRKLLLDSTCGQYRCSTTGQILSKPVVPITFCVHQGPLPWIADGIPRSSHTVFLSANCIV